MSFIVIFLVNHDFTGFASTINTEFVIDAQFANAFCFL